MQQAPEERLQRARQSLAGLSVGDAFGECFFGRVDIVLGVIATRTLPTPPWTYTDDTQMALSLYALLRAGDPLDQERLAQSFAVRYERWRGYGAAMHAVFQRLRQGEPWPEVARSLFEGEGSFGNGAAMRVAPLGAYYADDLDRAVGEAIQSAEVTHAHPDGIAGAIAVAVAAGVACRLAQERTRPRPAAFLRLLLPFVPPGAVHDGLRHASTLPEGTSVQQAVRALGNGTEVSAQDTVPFALWCAATHLDSFEEAMWWTVGGLGDRDTTCAMVGGVVAAYTGSAGIPPSWLAWREPLPAWAVG